MYSIQRQLCQLPQYMQNSFEPAHVYSSKYDFDDNSLDVSENNFNGDKADILAALMWLLPPPLKKILCCSCSLTSADLENLLSRLSQLLSTSEQQLALREWKLTSNDIDDSGVATLIDHLTLFPNLSRITFRDNRADNGQTEFEVKQLKPESGAQRRVTIAFGSMFITDMSDSPKEFSSDFSSFNGSTIESVSLFDDDVTDEEEEEVDSELETLDATDPSVSHTTKEVNTVQPVTELPPQASTSVPPESPFTQPQESAKMMISDFEACADVSDRLVQSATTCWDLDKVHPTLDGRGITIAILDSGVYIQHKAFADLQRFRGMNFVPSQENATWKTATDSHGSMATFVAGGESFEAQYIGTTIGEIPVEKRTVELKPPRTIPSGVAPGAQLLICNVFETCSSTGLSNSNPIAVVNALKYLKDLNDKSKPKLTVHVISMSFGIKHDPRSDNEELKTQLDKISDLITGLKQQGVICVAAVGNYGGYQSGALFPAVEDDVISVGALDKDGRIAGSNPKDKRSVDVYAPGENIPIPLVHPGIVNGVAYSRGSSCATPAVAGIVALLLQFDRKKHELFPSDSQDPVVVNILRRNFRKFKEIKRILREEMKDSDMLRPYEFFRYYCRLPLP